MDITSELYIQDFVDHIEYSFVFNFNSNFQETEIIIRSPFVVNRDEWDNFREAMKNNSHYCLSFVRDDDKHGTIIYDGVKLLFNLMVSNNGMEYIMESNVLINKKKYKDQFLVCLKSLLDDKRIEEFW